MLIKTRILANLKKITIGLLISHKKKAKKISKPITIVDITTMMLVKSRIRNLIVLKPTKQISLLASRLLLLMTTQRAMLSPAILAPESDTLFGIRKIKIK